MNTQHQDEDLQRTAPTLLRLKGREPFVVPEGFFAHFPHSVQAAAVAKDARTSPFTSWSRRLVWTLPMAALLVIALLLWRPQGNTGTGNEAMADHGSWWDLFDDELIREALLDDAPGTSPTTLDLDDDEWLAYWEDQDLLDLYLDLERP